jgi:hypothetical protein
MQRLAGDPAAFIQPSPSPARSVTWPEATQESMVIMEAAR